jgi:hypothetical protein
LKAQEKTEKVIPSEHSKQRANQGALGTVRSRLHLSGASGPPHPTMFKVGTESQENMKLGTVLCLRSQEVADFREVAYFYKIIVIKTFAHI